MNDGRDTEIGVPPLSKTREWLWAEILDLE